MFKLHPVSFMLVITSTKHASLGLSQLCSAHYIKARLTVLLQAHQVALELCQKSFLNSRAEVSPSMRIQELN